MNSSLSRKRAEELLQETTGIVKPKRSTLRWFFKEEEVGVKTYSYTPRFLPSQLIDMGKGGVLGNLCKKYHQSTDEQEKKEINNQAFSIVKRAYVA